MKVLLVAVNAKYIHSNLAVYDLKAYTENIPVEVELAEYTINQQQEEILRDIYEHKADVVAFSCYIWNITYVKALAEELHKIAPQVQIWFGGPEASYDAKQLLRELSYVELVIVGEGEETFAQLLQKHLLDGERLENIVGICYRENTGEICDNGIREYLPMDKIPFVYHNLDRFAHKILYYETSRGCPFRCSYCLSSIDKRVRLRSLSLVFPELQFFLDNKVDQVKFVDRTFNCNHEHAYEIWKYLLEHDNGITNFHFEVAADLLREEDFALFAQMRKGLIQLEIGIQSTYPDTITEIRRVMDVGKVAECVARVKKMHNIHQHLDLIAGLPFETFAQFQQSFNDVYAMRPDQLQLGFLKVLKGSYMEEKKYVPEVVEKFIDILSVADTLSAAEKYCTNAMVISDLKQVLDFTNQIANGKFAAIYDKSLVRGMGYYTGMVFEIVSPKFGSSVAGGGRYNDMIGKFLGESVSAVGFSIGFERISAILLSEGFVPPAKEKVVLAYMAETPFADVVTRANYLQKQGKIVTILKRSKKFGKQLDMLVADGAKSLISVEDGSVKALS